MRVIIIGGHFTPALAVIEALPKDTDVVYVGRKYAFEKDTAVSLEYQTITKMGIPFEELVTGRLQRKLSLQTLPSLLKIPKGFVQSLTLLKKHKPDILVGFGSYLSVPPCIVAKILGIPVIIHEQTLEAGLANKQLAKIAEKVCISWKSSEKFFPKNKTVLTGNPLPRSMFNQWAKRAKGATSTKSENPFDSSGSSGTSGSSICIIGGSSGSHAINVLVEGCLPQLLEKFAVFHQTGDSQQFKDFDRLAMYKKTLPQNLQRRYTIIKFIQPEQFASVLQQSDLVVSRSGINTITTLLLLQKISLLIPLPISQRNEQYKNALLLKDAGLGEILKQKDATPQILFDKIVFMHNNKKSYEKKISKTKEADIFLPSQKIVTLINDLYQEHTKKKKSKNT